MANRTYLLFRALGSPERLDVLRAILRDGPLSQPRLREQLGVTQPNLSKYLRDLSAQGLVYRAGNTRSLFDVRRRQELRALLRAAGIIHAEHYGEHASDGLALAVEMEEQTGSDEHH